MDSIKDRNGMDLTEAEDIKKRWQEYTEELYIKDYNLILTSKSVVLLLCAKMRSPVEVQDFLSSLLPCF